MRSVILFLFLLVIGCFFRNIEKIEDIKIVSQIIEPSAIHDSVPLPSYCKPESYKIVKTDKGYFAQLPGGSLYWEPFSNPQECQKHINEIAAASKQRWIDSGGLDF
jgi:hypothetical protein